jgi:hypothetical protein
MEYAAPRYRSTPRRSLLAPLVALLVGAAAAVGGYTLIDDDSTVQAPDKVVFVDTPGPGEGVRGIDDMSNPTVALAQPKVVVPYMSHGFGSQTGDVKHEAATAAAIGAGSSSQTGDVKHEAATAAAIGAGSSSQTGDVKHEAATAAAISAGSSTQDKDSATRTDPHGPAAQLHQR